MADPHGRPSDISRAHEIRSPEPGWWDVAGGKLTTYRLMGEQTVDQLARSSDSTVAQTLSLLSTLELEGLVCAAAGGRFRRRRG